MERTYIYNVNKQARYIATSSLAFPGLLWGTSTPTLFANNIKPSIDNSDNDLEIALVGIGFSNLHIDKDGIYNVSCDIVKEYQQGETQCNIIGKINMEVPSVSTTAAASDVVKAFDTFGNVVSGAFTVAAKTFGTDIGQAVKDATKANTTYVTNAVSAFKTAYTTALNELKTSIGNSQKADKEVKEAIQKVLANREVIEKIAELKTVIESNNASASEIKTKVENALTSLVTETAKFTTDIGLLQGSISKLGNDITAKLGALPGGVDMGALLIGFVNSIADIPRRGEMGTALQGIQATLNELYKKLVALPEPEPEKVEETQPVAETQQQAAPTRKKRAAAEDKQATEKKSRMPDKHYEFSAPRYYSIKASNDISQLSVRIAPLFTPTEPVSFKADSTMAWFHIRQKEM